MASARDPVVEVDHPVAEAAVTKQLEGQADVVGEGPVATAHDDRVEEQVALVDQPGPERLGGELGPPMARSRPDVSLRCRSAAGSALRSIRVRALDTASSPKFLRSPELG